ncbi:FadR/GntR family transcriptional regulator [Paracoccus zhejiangensis]|uniref:FadR family transcriptional regulator n=1 Tax=Paracoccus zhejiangensis TaxID=1077935 RepID=A0A2H5F147_9RHOB|nr:FadR/GntR family transcriptional regulator [Paracoccus zhejiangensis]AUH65270.1 FadR family transcriptional regulator [Paracoccus zhejiangensis]
MTKPNSPLRERPRNLVTSTLAKQILSGVFPPGAKLPTETELGEQLGVSRTALRESIRTLAGKGLIESKTRSGTVVLSPAQWNHLDPELLGWREELAPDLDFARSLTEARQVIEPAAARFAAERATGQDLGRMQDSFDAMCRADAQDIEASVSADESFHLAVLAASHNPVFINFGAMVGTALRNAFRLTTSASENFAATLDMHGEVLEAIRMRRPDEAGQRMAELLGIASRDLARVIAQEASGR